MRRWRWENLSPYQSDPPILSLAHPLFLIFSTPIIISVTQLFDHIYAALAAKMLIWWCVPAAHNIHFQFSVTTKCPVCLHLVLFYLIFYFIASKGSGCLEGGRSMRCCIHLTIGRWRLWNISDSPLYSWRQRIDALNAGCRGLVSSLYSRQLTYPHYITIRLPLKVILPEHNHTQSKPQTSYITQTVNSPGV